MKIAFEFFLAGILALWLCGNAYADNIRIVVYGDSLTSGYDLQADQLFATRLDQKFKAVGFSNVSVIGMSTAGATTADGFAHIDALLNKRPDIVILELGTNDAMRGIDIKFIYGNLIAIASKLEQNRIYTILIGNKAPASMGSGYGTQLAEAYRRISVSYNMPLYPFALDVIAGRPDLSLADGLHPNEKGVQVMVDRIYPLADAGVRWKWQVIQQQQQWMQQGADGLPDGLRPTGELPVPTTH